MEIVRPAIFSVDECYLYRLASGAAEPVTVPQLAGRILPSHEHRILEAWDNGPSGGGWPKRILR